uniref:NADH dehydrogenase [ubiquinone] 1 subunit C1, mitochondrial n=1 Tax=Ursus americanus TaxID=9643 RepID=A0A452RD85_URSAM
RAPRWALRSVASLLLPLPLTVISLTLFLCWRPPHGKPNWLEGGLTLGTSVFLQTHLIKQRNEDVIKKTWVGTNFGNTNAIRSIK